MDDARHGWRWTQEKQIEVFADHLIDEFYIDRRCSREQIIRLLDIGLERHIAWMEENKGEDNL